MEIELLGWCSGVNRSSHRAWTHGCPNVALGCIVRTRPCQKLTHNLTHKPTNNTWWVSKPWASQKSTVCPNFMWNSHVIYQGHWRWLWRREVTRLSETLPQLRSSSPKDPIKKTWFIMGYPIISTNTNKNNYWDIHWYNGYLPIIYTMGYPKWQFSGSTFRRTTQFCRLVRSKTIQPTHRPKGGCHWWCPGWSTSNNQSYQLT